MKPEKVIKDKNPQAESAAVTVNGTYKTLFNAMQPQAAPTAIANPQNTMHPGPLKKPKGETVDEVENKPKIRPDSTSTR